MTYLCKITVLDFFSKQISKEMEFNVIVIPLTISELF